MYARFASQTAELPTIVQKERHIPVTGLFAPYRKLTVWLRSEERL
jgi:hypothetical protein